MRQATALLYLTMPSPSLEKSRSFYEKVLQWEMEDGSGHIESTSTPCGLSPAFDDEDGTQIYLSVYNLDDALDTLKQAGGRVLYRDSFSIGECAFCMDNQGTQFALQEPADEHMREQAMFNQKGYRHGDLFRFVLPVRNIEKAMDFYGEVMGWTFDDKGMISNVNGPQGCLTQAGRKSKRRPVFWFQVESVDEAKDLVMEVGGEASEIVDASCGKMCTCKDDQGVEFVVIERPESDFVPISEIQTITITKPFDQ